MEIPTKDRGGVKLDYRPRSEGDNTCGSVCLSVRPFVRLSVLSCLNRLTVDPHFWHGGDLDPSYAGIEG